MNVLLEQEVLQALKTGGIPQAKSCLSSLVLNAPDFLSFLAAPSPNTAFPIAIVPVQLLNFLDIFKSSNAGNGHLPLLLSNYTCNKQNVKHMELPPWNALIPRIQDMLEKAVMVNSSNLPASQVECNQQEEQQQQKAASNDENCAQPVLNNLVNSDNIEVVLENRPEYNTFHILIFELVQPIDEQASNILKVTIKLTRTLDQVYLASVHYVDFKRWMLERTRGKLVKRFVKRKVQRLDFVDI